MKRPVDPPYGMTAETIGTCSLCGGPVHKVEGIVMSYIQCDKCGAVPQTVFGPVIPMIKASPEEAHKWNFFKKGERG